MQSPLTPIAYTVQPSYANAIENSTFQGYDAAWPTDNSFLGNHQIGDMFLRIPNTVYTPYIAHTGLDGFVLVHGKDHIWRFTFILSVRPA